MGHERFDTDLRTWSGGAAQCHDPDWVHAFVDSRSPKLSGLSRRESLKHP